MLLHTVNPNIYMTTFALAKTKAEGRHPPHDHLLKSHDSTSNLVETGLYPKSLFKEVWEM